MELFKVGVCSAATLIFLAVSCCAGELTLSVNFRRPVSISGERFLSLSVDPETLLHPDGGLSTNFEKSIHIARALAPAYIRLGGPISNSFDLKGIIDPQANHNETNLFSESNWNRVHHWVEKAGLDLIACISPENLESSPDDNRLTSILSLNDRMGYNTSWQLGYECQTRCNISASDLGKHVARLRRILDENPRFSASIITGPDVISWETQQQQMYLQNYLSYAAPALTAITWHPDFGVTHADDSVISMRHDHLAADKENLILTIGHLIGDRPLWIAESKKDRANDKFAGALTWAHRLGEAGKLKVDTIMRQLDDVSSTKPDFWVSLLHKQLVGGKSFDVKLQTAHRNQSYFYCHCTKPSEWYERGSVTIFGLNLSPDPITVELKNQKIATIHKYILSPGSDNDNQLLSENVLLNNESLSLINDTYVPSIKPEILVDRRGLNLDLSPDAIGFWVLPELKIRSCMEDGEHANENVAPPKAVQTGLNIDLPEDLHPERTPPGPIETIRTLVKRRAKHRDSPDDEKNRRKLMARDIRRELNRLKKFLKKKLDYYHDRNTQRTERFSETSRDRLDLEESIEARLKSHKERLLEFQNSIQAKNDATLVERANKEILSKSLELISKIEHSFENMRARFGDQRTITPRVKDRLRSLYELLRGSNAQEASDSSETEKEVSESPRRSRRDLDGVVDQLAGRKDASKARSRMEQLRERRNDRKLKRKDDVRREVQPSPLEHRAADSGENDFYGFFRRAPAKDFPQGDVFLGTGDSAQNNDYDYVRDEDYPSGSKERAARVPQETADQIESEDTWVEESNEHHGYAPNEFFENIKLNNYPIKQTTGNAELSEVEQMGHEESEQSRDESAQDQSEEEILKEGDPRLSIRNADQKHPDYRESFGLGSPSNLRSSIRARQVQNLKPTYFTPQSSFLKNTRSRLGNQPRSILGRRIDSISGRSQYPENLEFPVGAYDNAQHKRPKRNKDDLTTLLDQEMIKEDESNSKDCRCRVIRKLTDDSIHKHDRKRRNTEEVVLENARNPSDQGLTGEISVPLETLDPNTPEAEAELTQPEPQTTMTREGNSAPGAEAVIVQRQALPNTELESKTPATTLQEAVETIGESSLPIADDTANSPNYPVDLSIAENAENAGQLDEAATVAESPPIETLLDKDTELLTDEANLHDETQFFRAASPDSQQTEATINPVEDIPGNVKDVQEHVASSGVPTVQEETLSVVPQDVEGEGTDSRSSTTETIVGVEEQEAEFAPGQAENDDKDRSTTGTLKREAPPEETTPLGVPDVTTGPANDTTLGSANDDNKKSSHHPKHSCRTKLKENERADELARAREARLMARTKAVLALRKENDSRKPKRIMQIPAGSSSREIAPTHERQKKRAEQIERLRGKLREKREKMLQQYEREILDIVDKIDDEEKKNLKRREALEKLADSDDFKSMIDREKLAYVLMYNPQKYSLIKRDTYKSRDASVEFVTPDDAIESREIYERNRRSKRGRYVDDSRSKEYPSSYLVDEGRRTYGFRKEGERVKSQKYTSSDQQDSGTYYAIIESLTNPYHHSRKAHDRRKEYIEERTSYPARYYADSSTDNDDDDSVEDDREAGGNHGSSGRKVYIIDPSTYRGGEPTLELHESPLRSSKVSPAKGDHPRKRSYIPRGRNSAKSNPETSEDSGTLYVLGAPSARDKSAKHNNVRLRGLLLNPVRRPSTKKPGNSAPPPTDRKSSKPKETPIKTTAKPDPKVELEASENEGKNPVEKGVTGTPLADSGNTGTQEETGDRVRQDSPLANDRKDTNEQSADETIVRKRRSTDSGTKRRAFKRIATAMLRRKAGGRRRNRASYVCRKENSDEASQEDPAVLYELVKHEDHYKAVPSGNSRGRSRPIAGNKAGEEEKEESDPDASVDDGDAIVGRSFDDYARLMNLDGSGSFEGSDETGSNEFLHIFLPSLARSNYSPFKLLRSSARYDDDDDDPYVAEESRYREALRSREDESVESKERYSDDLVGMRVPAEDDSELPPNSEEVGESPHETEVETEYIGEPDYQWNSEEGSEEYSDLEDAIVSDKYGILMVLPRKKEHHSRHRRDAAFGDQEENDGSSEITFSASTEHQLHSEHVTNRIDEKVEPPSKKNAVSYLKKKNLRKEYANKKIYWNTDIAENNDASFISNTVPKLADVVVSGLKKAQNLTDSVEQLIDDIDQNFNDTLAIDNDQQFHRNCTASAAHNAFHSMIINVKKFFTFLGGVTRILHG